MDYKLNQKALFAKQLSQAINVPLKANEFTYRNVESTHNRYGFTLPEVKSTGNISECPQAAYIQPPGWNHRDHCEFIAREVYDIKSPYITIHSQSDNYARIYVDGVEVDYTDRYDQVFTHHMNIEPGEHVFTFYSKEDTGGAGLAFAIKDGDSWRYSSKNTKVKDVTDWPEKEYLDYSLDTSVEVDVTVSPSEVYGDYVEFDYQRVPIEQVFGLLDADDAKGVQLPYDISNISMLSDTIDNFEQVFNQWYRFSHNASGNYPAKSSELDAWVYEPEYDCIRSTVNSNTFVGFISDKKSDNYTFSTIVSSNNGDDDTIAINLAAHTQGEYDDKEHTLAVICSRGGTGQFVRVQCDYLQVDQKAIRVLDSDSAEANNNPGWRPWYAHIHAVRDGDLIDVYVKMFSMPDGDRDTELKGVVDERSELSENDMIAEGYLHTTINLAEDAPMFQGPSRYGYGQFSQSNARFWNIRRPNDAPEVTKSLVDWFKTHYGFNITGGGVNVENLGANKFKVNFDSLVYKGSLELTPQ